MNNSIIVGIFLISLVLGSIKYKSIYSYYDFEKDEKKPRKNAPWQLKFAEIWNDSFNFFIAGLIVYYFALIRLPLLLKGEALVFSDFILFIIFILGVFGHLCVMSLNITKGVEAILSRVLERK
ncbi:MAG TPA: hypothetical protein VI819_03370 [Patescibacteria group bacterium]|nr:hypothetical protein [Patescibacteria group bacterium]